MHIPADKPIALLSWRPAHAIETLVACGRLPLASVETASLGLPRYHCPYGLGGVSSGAAVLVTSHWLYETARLGYDPVNDILRPLRRRFDRIIGFDHHDAIALCFSDNVIEQFDVVLKWNGLYRNPRLYLHATGAADPAGNWSSEAPSSRVVGARSPESLAKVKASVPCLLNVAAPVRRAVRRLFGMSVARRSIRDAGEYILNKVIARPPRHGPAPPYTVHFYAGLSNWKRAEAATLLKQSGLPWLGGITGVFDRMSAYRTFGLTHLSTTDQESLTAELQRSGLMTPAVGPVGFRRTMWKCKAVLSIAGHGELCFRMAEAWANGRVLVCQDMSHIEMLYPLQNGRNVVYCKPDLSDLVDILTDIECNFDRYRPIAIQGFEDWREWSNRADEIVRQGFHPLYSDAVGGVRH